MATAMAAMALAAGAFADGSGPLPAADGARPLPGLHDVNERSREEKLAFFRENVFGHRYAYSPSNGDFERPDRISFVPACEDRVMLDGAAVRKRVRIEYAGGCGSNSFVATAFIPLRARGPVPAFVLVCNRDPAKVADPERTVKSEFFPVEEIVARGYAAVTFFNQDVAPDRNYGNRRGVFACFEPEARYRDTGAWGTISAWAWGASRVMDWIEAEELLDARKVAVVGHSRGGKTALWAAATDERFAMACVNGSGCVGAKLNHLALDRSESFADIMERFPHWFCARFVRLANRERTLDFDQHELLSCVAPRLLCVTSGDEDRWAGPEGERMATELARPAWADPGRVAYRARRGGHDLRLEDWKVYLDHAARHGW